MTIKETVEFDPNALAQKDAGIFGLPFDTQTARQVIIPVPWEATVSYREGTARGPRAILKASMQVDLYDADAPDAWKFGIAMDDFSPELEELSHNARLDAEKYIEMLEEGETPDETPKMKELLDRVNKSCEEMNAWVQTRAAQWIEQGKLVSLVGGDHSTPLGLLRELGNHHKEFGILHFDAHADLRDAYEGFKYSHASIMFNVLEIKSMKKMVQVGIRDYCDAEIKTVAQSKGRIVPMYDRDVKARLFEGEPWREICDEITNQLPQKVYVSFDIDGLDPKLCPNTGTPVPGGLEFEEALFLVRQLVRSGRQIIGFDVNEVAPGEDEDNEWDANVGARLLYRIAGLAAVSNKWV
ncbi:MAG TPA: agmatinase family protein [Planktothrix sp.]